MRALPITTICLILLPVAAAAGPLPICIFMDGFEARSDCAWSTALWYVDVDGDTYGDLFDPGQPPACPEPSTLVCNNLDCDDGNDAVNPGAAEICNGIDDDCDIAVDAADSGLVVPLCENQNGVCNGATKPPERCVGGAWAPCTQVDYFNFAEFYEVDESLCDGFDNDCDGLVDETCPPT